ncbi:hypothetical protein DM01DRAFT_1363439 [Hesseltinella vesiculosa]|uniref:Uncharacterized protein n=1 Tax=Hesseltinella vesiculosa TaxID=101127 RepID=A0A1X2GE12_9FUNG|nr:hypothetical protein DM01DRAFT_1363439 [Hesseltinella vesiculosa]
MEQLGDKLAKVNIEDKPTEKVARFDKEALRQRWAILGKEPEQVILSAIRKSCFETFARKDFGSTLQKIKASFVDRDYEGIFTETNNLSVYSASYVPGRALCYYKIFTQAPFLKLWAKKTKVYAIGAGSGSELVGLAAAMTRVPGENQQVELLMQDIGSWQDVLTQFEQHTARHWHLTEAQLTCARCPGSINDGHHDG